MKVAILSESSADEAAIEILVAAVLGVPIHRATLFDLRSRGWASVFDNLSTVIKHLHYRTDADGLVVVVDSNHSQPHHPDHRSAPKPSEKCRLCRMSGIVRETLSHLRPVAGRRRLNVALGMASPAIEAWYLCGKRQGVTEAAWEQGVLGEACPFTKNQLKQFVYGTDRPSLVLETTKAAEEAKRLATDVRKLRELFPHGFGCLADDLLKWEMP